jgi:Tfp pilus assembly protein PilN
MNKLLDKLKSSYSGINKVLSLTVNLSDESQNLNGLIISQKKNTILPGENINQLDQEDILKIPFIFTCEGKGVLNKYIKTSWDKVKIRNVIPNIKEEDFYINYTPTSSGCWVSLVRRDTILEILKKHGLKQALMIDLHIGPSSIQWLNNSELVLPKTLGSNELIFNDNQLQEIQKVSDNSFKNNNILGEQLTYNLHLPFIAAVVTLNNLNINQKDLEFTSTLNELKSKKTFESTLKLVLGLLLVMFMGNVVVNQLLKNSQLEINQEAESYKALNQKVQSLKNNVEVKNDFIQKLQLSKNIQYSFYAEQIGASTPKSIQLTQFQINPLNKNIRKNKLISFTNGQIKVYGVCKSSHNCNDWVEDLRAFKWAKTVELAVYNINKDRIGEFQINVEF